MHRLAPFVGARLLANREGTGLVVREQARSYTASHLMVTPPFHTRTNVPSLPWGEGWGERTLQQYAATAVGALA